MRRRPKARRDRELVRLRVEQGWSYGRLAERYRISGERVRQILQRERRRAVEQAWHAHAVARKRTKE